MLVQLSDSEVLQRLNRFREQQLGEFGEQIVSNVLRASGVPYIPLSKINRGGAPRVEKKNGFTALPDIDAAGAEWTAFVEVKCKSQSVLFRKKNQIRHGIDRVRWVDYLNAAEAFKKQCAVAIVELHHEDGRWSGALLIERLVELGEPYAGEGSERHMVYWRRKQFRDLESFSPSELWAISEGRDVRSFDYELQQIFAGKRQKDLFG